VDCTLCVQVCPTGIDIRNGLQNECIGCAACIDVCDQVMDKVGAPRGLIRYATENGIKNHWTRSQMLARVLRPRVLIYGAGLFLLSGAFAFSLQQRQDLLIDVVKDRSTMAREVEDGVVENAYRLQLINRTERPLRLNLSAEGLVGLQLQAQGGSQFLLAPAVIGTVPVQLRLPQQAGLAPGTHTVYFVAEDRDHPGNRFRSKAVFYLPR
jgi:cytochrome c oxidase accessory protein FixG